MYQSNLGDEVLISLRKIINNVETAENPKVDMWCHLGTSLIRAPGEGSVYFSISLMNIKNPSCLKVVFFCYVVSSLSSFSLFLLRVLCDFLSFLSPVCTLHFLTDNTDLADLSHLARLTKWFIYQHI